MLSELRGKVEQIQKGAISNIHNVLFSTLVPFLRFLATGGKNTHTHTHTHTHPSLQKLGFYMAYILDYFTDLFK